ncbi:NADPH-dependent ferric siderophore reductase [Bordetella genomosp. 8]|uniref:NADPH-dependent ferric siderophore reductase n=1 Tax=Bordetella genomosp. 8 TaxID=1416806 RepID=A0A1W6YJL2_9BORD|nr:siderophore-interacting protein [Bordetella genomosp. 8]ARP81184.1 NADPH-dependent ferric siderophore reductase [Bordetella genomosp. 8]
MTTLELSVQRVRHDLKMRMLQVVRTRLVSPQLLCVTLTGEDLRGFVSASFDDHVKVFFPEPGQDRPVLPIVGLEGISMPAGAPRPAARDYTPRRYDADANELDIEFVLHGDGPASSWAAQARPGQFIGVGGPRGSFIVPMAFDWHLLIGDETALPAIARRLQELPASTRAIAIIEVADAKAEIPLPSREGITLQWLHRDGAPAGDPARLEQAARQLQLPAGEGYVWAAAESVAAKAVRRVLVDERGIPKNRIRASSYWKRGASGVHETLED